MEIPGKAVGMYSDEPSNKAGMNWLPIRNINGIVSARKARFSSNVNARCRKQNRKTGR